MENGRAILQGNGWVVRESMLDALTASYRRSPDRNLFLTCGISLTALLPETLPAFETRLQKSVESPITIGTAMRFTNEDPGAGPVWHRFRVRPPGGEFQMVRDFGPASALEWRQPPTHSFSSTTHQRARPGKLSASSSKARTAHRRRRRLLAIQASRGVSTSHDCISKPAIPLDMSSKQARSYRQGEAIPARRLA